MESTPQTRTCKHLAADHALVAFGANLGDRKGTIRAAIADLEGHAACTVLAVSPLFETVPVDAPIGSGDFLNGALLMCTELNSSELLELLHQLEQEYGRERDGVNTPRTLDLDLLVFGREFSEDESLVLPHPRMHERLFVLDPVAILCPDLQLARADQKTVRARQLELRESS